MRERAVADHRDAGAGDLVDPVADPGAEREHEPGADHGSGHVAEAQGSFQRGHRGGRGADAEHGRGQRHDDPCGRHQRERERRALEELACREHGEERDQTLARSSCGTR